MELTYVVLNLAVLSLLSGYILIKKRWVFSKTEWCVLVFLLTLTAVFDSFIIASGIVAYDQSQILSLYIGKAPIEDFAYTVAAVILIPFVWRRLGGKDV